MLLLASLMLMTAEPLKVLVLDLRAESVSQQTGRLIRDEIAVDMGRDDRLDVLSSEDLRRVISVDAERKSIGCDESSCLAEVGAALGARYIIHGSIGVLGSTTIVHLNLFDTEQGRSVSRETAEAKNADDLLPAVRGALARVRARMLGQPQPAATVQEAPSNGPPMMVIAGGGVAGLGAAVAIIGGVMMALAWPAYSNAADPKDGGVAVTEREKAQTQGMIGTLVVGVGAAAALGGGALLVLGLME
jgi:TolB-like protein